MGLESGLGLKEGRCRAPHHLGGVFLTNSAKEAALCVLDQLALQSGLPLSYALSAEPTRVAPSFAEKSFFANSRISVQQGAGPARPLPIPLVEPRSAH